MFLRSCLMMVSLAGALSASAAELFWVGESEPQRFDTRMLAAKGFGAAVVHDGGRLTSDASWAANAVHIVYGTVVVETNVTLTIQAGAVVQFAGGGIYVRGDCIANGVHFADAASDEVVSYVLKGNVVTDEATTFRGRDYQDDFQRHSDSSSFAFDTRGLLGAAPSGTVVHWGGRLSENETWAAGQTHLVYGSVTVSTNVTLTVERGAVVKFAGGGIRADGSLVAEGALFADLDDDSVGGDTRKDGWTQPHVSYAIDGNVYDAADTVYRCLDTHGEWLLDGASVASAFNTRGYGAADLTGIVTHEGAVTSDETWSADETHVVYGTLYVAAGVMLTIEPGAVVKFVGGGLVVDGRCVARGVTFTDLDDDSHGATRANAKLPEASYVLEGEIETDYATVMMCSKGKQNDLADPGVSRVFRLETDLERVKFAGEPREVTFNAAWDGSTAVEVTETRPDGSTVVLTNGTAACAGVFLWDAGETPGLYTLRHMTDTNELTASFYRLFNAQVHSGPISETNVWEAGVVHVIDRSVSVKAGGSLLIEPGAVVKFFPGSGLTIEAGGICTARDVIFTSVHDISVGGDTLGEGGATEPSEEEYLIVGYIRDSATTEYRYGTHSLSGTIAGVETWEANRVYVIDGTLTVAAGGSLAIARGAIVKFTSGSTLAVENGATCSAEGVIFTHIADDTAGGDTMGDGDETQPEIGAYTITGLILDDETTQYRYGAPVVTSGTILKSTFWRSRNVYRVTGNLTIANGATLTIMPGAIVKFDDGKSMTVASGGTLNAIGTRAQPIVFTSVKDDEHGWDANGDGSATRADCGDWKEIVVSGAFNANYVNVLYGAGGGASDLVDAIKICSGGTVSMKNSRIEHMQRYAVCDEGGSSHFENCVINDVYMAFRHGSGYRDVFDNCVIHDCSYLSNNGGQVFRNCIVTDMTTDWQWGTQYGLVQCLNCIFWNKDGNFGPHSLPRMQSGSVGNIWSDPMFVDSDNGDFRIVEGSPCIDAGDGTVAPELDWYGQPRVTFPSAQQTGKPDAKGRFVDIGIYEVQPRNVKSDIDLSIVSVAAESSVTVGATLKVSWTVENLGSVNATGSWRDMFELIDSSGATVKLGSYTVSGSIVAGGQRVFTTSFRVPAAAVGEARLRVKVNPERDIFEGTATGNNVAIADGTIDIAVAAYSASEHSVVSIDAGSSTALTIPADSGITALIIKGGAGLSAFGAYGYVPKALRNDITAVRLEDGSLLLTLPTTDSADDFTFVIANGGYGAETVSIEPVTESLEVTEVTPNRLANTGDGYLTLRGIALDRVAQVRLVGGATFAPTAFSAASSGEISATFPLADATPSIYALEVEDADGETYRLDAAVEIYKPKMGPKLEAHLEIPTAVRQGRIYTGKIVYSNVGDTDMYAPCLRVVAKDALMRMYDDETCDSQTLQMVGISSTYPAGVLSPGDKGELSFGFQAGASPSFNLSVDSDDSAEWQKVLTELSRSATVLNERGRKVVDTLTLNLYAKQCQNGDRFIRAACGVVVDEEGTPIQDAMLSAFLNDECVSVDFTDVNGRFVLDGLSSNYEYRIKVVNDNGNAELRQFIGDLDLTNIRITLNKRNVVKCRVGGLPDFVKNIEDVVVMASPLYPNDEYILCSGKLDSEASCEFHFPVNGPYIVSVQIEGQVLAVEIFIFDAFTTEFEVKCCIGNVLKGLVAYSDGSICKNQYMCVSRNGVRISETYTDDDGMYYLTGLACGEYYIGFGWRDDEAYMDKVEIYESSAVVEKDIIIAAPSRENRMMLKNKILRLTSTGNVNESRYIEKRSWMTSLTSREDEYNALMARAEKYLTRDAPNWPCSHNKDTYDDYLKARQRFLFTAQQARFMLEILYHEKIAARWTTANESIRNLPGISDGYAIVEFVDLMVQLYNEFADYLESDHDFGQLVADLWENAKKIYACDVAIINLVDEVSYQLKSGWLKDVVTRFDLNNPNPEIFEELLLQLVKADPDNPSWRQALSKFYHEQMKRNDALDELKEMKKNVNGSAWPTGKFDRFMVILDKAFLILNAFESVNKIDKVYSNLQAMETSYDAVENKNYGDALVALINAYNKSYHYCGEEDVVFEHERVEEFRPVIPQSCDPNEMVGPMGKGDPETERFVKPGEWMTYTVYFENKSDAAAAAQEVTVSNPLSEWLDWSTFEMGEVAFNNQIDLGLVGKKNGTSEVTMNGTNYAVRTELKLNEQAGVADWYMRIVDSTTETGWPEDVFAGFLPPNDETFCGEGHITYRIKVREDAPKGARIDNSATIVFDYNDPIETDPAWWNTIGSAGGEAAFAANELTVDEGGTLKVAVCGGHESLASSVQVLATYNTAAAADLDLKGARVDGVKSKSFKFPVTLEWAAGEIGEREIEIPVAVDKAVEADEFLTLQLANPMNLEIGDVSICTVTIHDPQYDALKAKVAAGTATKAEADALAKADKVFAGKAYVRALANDATRGKVTGSALAADGKKLTLKATANKGWVFAGWYTDPACTAGRELTGYGDYRNPSLSYPNTNGAVTVYARFIAPEEDSLSLGEDFLPAELAVGHSRYVPVPVESVSYPTVTFSGLPSGVRYDAALGGLTGAPKKTAKPTTVTVTVKNLGGYRIVRKYELSVVAFEAMNPSEPPAKRLSDAAPFHSVALTRNDDFAGKVTGAGMYQAGKKVTLKATANKGFVFSGWYEGGVDGGRGAAALPAVEPVSQLASYAFAMPSNDLAYVARFVTVDEDRASVGATVNGSAFGAACVGEAVTKLATNVMAGVYLQWPVAASALSQPTVKVSGLPSGLKFTAKPVTAKVGSGKAAVTVTNVPPNTICGAPTAASKTAKDKTTGLMTVTPSKVKVTVTTAGKSKSEYAIDLTVDPLPAWAQGEFSGLALSGAFRRGSASVSVTAAGKVSGKVVVNGTNCSFSATSYDAACRTIGETNLVAVVTGKLGKVPVTGEIAVVESGAQGAVAGATMELCRNVWKDKGADPVPAEAQGLYTVKLRPDEFSFPGIGTGHLSLTVDKKGAVKVAGKAADGTSLSASATLMPGAEAGRHFVDLFAAPSAYKGGYVAGRLDLDTSGAVSSPYCLDWTSFNPQSTGDYALGGFSCVLAAPGAWYSKTDSLTNHYHTLNFAAPDATERVPPASAQAHWGDLTVSVDATGRKFVVDQKATKPVQDKGSRAWRYDGANDAALTFSFTQATGIWKGSFLWWFDGAKHTSQKVPFEGVLVQGEDLEGFGTVDASSTYVPLDKRGNPQKAKSYKYRESVPVSFRAE